MITWTDGSPEEIAQNVKIIATRTLQLVQDTGVEYASRGQSHMKRNRPWEDQTSAARRELYGRAESHDWGCRIIYGGGTGESAPYFKFLELGTKYMGPYAIVKPTMQIYKVRAFRAAAIRVRGLLA